MDKDNKNNFSVEDELNRIYKNMMKEGPSNTVKLQVNVVNKSDNPTPKHETSGAAGFDFRANLPDGPKTLGPLERAIIPTGLYYEIPMGFEMQVRPRSGLAAKKGVTVLNSPGTIDADYRGEVGIILVNLSSEVFVVDHGDRIAQGVIATCIGETSIEFNNVDKLSETDRGAGGFGSTGIK